MYKNKTDKKEIVMQQVGTVMHHFFEADKYGSLVTTTKRSISHFCNATTTTKENKKKLIVN